MIDVVEWCGRNEFFDVNDSPAGVNRPLRIHFHLESKTTVSLPAYLPKYVELKNHPVLR